MPAMLKDAAEYLLLFHISSGVRHPRSFGGMCSTARLSPSLPRFPYAVTVLLNRRFPYITRLTVFSCSICHFASRLAAWRRSCSHILEHDGNLKRTWYASALNRLPQTGHLHCSVLKPMVISPPKIQAFNVLAIP